MSQAGADPSAASQLGGRLGAGHASTTLRAFPWGEALVRNGSVEDLGLSKDGLILCPLVIR